MKEEKEDKYYKLRMVLAYLTLAISIVLILSMPETRWFPHQISYQDSDHHETKYITIYESVTKTKYQWFVDYLHQIQMYQKVPTISMRQV